MITEYVKGKPYFSLAAEKIAQHAYLDAPLTVDALIVGGGIDGACVAYYFGKAGIDTALIEKSRLGYCCTACATALLEYQLDDHAEQLAKYFSAEELADVYRRGMTAIEDIDRIVKERGNNCHFSKRGTLLFTQKQSEAAELEREYAFRIAHGFDVRLLTPDNNPFPFSLAAGIYAPHGGGELNPYLFEKQLLEGAEENGVRVFEHTEATKITREGNSYRVTTNYGIDIKCNKIICATGYNTRLFTEKKLCDKFISYTIVTNPLPGVAWEGRCLIQDNNKPYHYMRLSPDDRIIMGGGDLPFVNDTLLEKPAEKIYAELLAFTQSLFPAFADKMHVDYSFCGAFSATKNNLAVVGESPDAPNIYYCLGYGANGIIYSILGAQELANGMKE